MTVKTPAPEVVDKNTEQLVKTLIKNGVDNKITKGYKKAFPEVFADVTGDNENISTLGDVQGEFMPSNPDFRGAGNDKGNNKLNNIIAANSDKQKVADSITTGKTLVLADACNDTTFDGLQSTLGNFFSKITGPGNAILNIPNEIKAVSDIMSLSMGGFVNKLTGSVGDYLESAISGGFDMVATAILAKVGVGFPYSAAIAEIIGIETSLMPGISKLFDGIRCAGPKIGNALKGVFTDLITSAVKNVVSVPACAVQQILGAATNKVKNMVDDITGPLLGPISKVLGIATNVQGFLTAGIDVFKGVKSFLSCDPPSCKGLNKITIGQGDTKNSSKNEKKSNIHKVFDGISNNVISSTAQEKADEFEEEYGKWELFGKPLSEASELDPCYTGNPLKCGLPKVEIFGGGGYGAAGKVILGKFINKLDPDDIFKSVQTMASIVGVEIINPGSGYTSDPIIRFVDNCGQGYGAYGRANVDYNQQSPTYGQVRTVTMVTTGENYPAEDEEVPLFIDQVIIQNPGDGYADGDTLDNFELKVMDGKIVGGNLLNIIPYDDLPKLNIKSNTGVGAILKPIMSKTRPQGDVVQVIDCVR